MTIPSTHQEPGTQSAAVTVENTRNRSIPYAANNQGQRLALKRYESCTLIREPRSNRVRGLHPWRLGVQERHSRMGVRSPHPLGCACKCGICTVDWNCWDKAVVQRGNPSLLGRYEKQRWGNVSPQILTEGMRGRGCATGCAQKQAWTVHGDATYQGVLNNNISQVRSREFKENLTVVVGDMKARSFVIVLNLDSSYPICLFACTTWLEVDIRLGFLNNGVEFLLYEIACQSRIRTGGTAPCSVVET